MEKVVLKANERKEFSKFAVHELRRNGRVPGVYYLKKTQPISVEVAETAINPLVFTAETHLVSLSIEGRGDFDCVMKDVQFDPVTDRVIHFDLLGLTSDEKFQLEVPLQYLGSAIGIKEGGILQQSLHKLEIECLPADIPQHLEIDVTNLKLGHSIHVKDLSFPNISILTPEDTVIASVVHPKIEKEPAAEGAEAAAEPEVIGKGKTEEEEE
jgi:large subunit ribosomal protein L25